MDTLLTKLLWTCLFSVALLSACSSETVKRSAYQSIYHKECLDRTQTPNCEPTHPDYDTYQRQRNEALEKSPQ